MNPTRNPVRLAGIGVITGLILLMLIGWLLVLSPRWATTARLQAQTADLELGQASLLRKERDLLNLADQLPETAAAAQQLFSAMPQTAELPALLNQLTEAATDAGISDERIQVINTAIPESIAAESESDQPADVRLATMRVDMTVSGTINQLDRFVANMESLERSFVISDVNVVAGGLEDERLNTLTLAGELFVLESPLPDLIQQAEAVAAAIDR